MSRCPQPVGRPLSWGQERHHGLSLETQPHEEEEQPELCLTHKLVCCHNSPPTPHQYYLGLISSDRGSSALGGLQDHGSCWSDQKLLSLK